MMKPLELPQEEPEKVSNLVSDGVKMNDKYDDALYLKHNPQHWNNVRTMGMLKDLTNSKDIYTCINSFIIPVVLTRRGASFWKDG